MKLLIALGNPGTKYQNTRHNAGFWLMDQIAEEFGIKWEEGISEKFQGYVTKGQVHGEPCILLKPVTYMNLSGRSVLKASQFFKIPSVDWIVLHDDIDLPFAKVKTRVGGGHGGHNGIRSILEETGQSDFSRIKIGVGRPIGTSSDKTMPSIADFVLAPLPMNEVTDFIQKVRTEVDLRLKELLKRKD